MSTAFVPEGVEVLTVGELTRKVKNLLEKEYQTVWVAGVVSNL